MNKITQIKQKYNKETTKIHSNPSKPLSLWPCIITRVHKKKKRKQAKLNEKKGQISIAKLQVAIATSIKQILKIVHTMPEHNPNINNNCHHWAMS